MLLLEIFCSKTTCVGKSAGCFEPMIVLMDPLFSEVNSAVWKTSRGVPFGWDFFLGNLLWLSQGLTFSTFADYIRFNRKLLGGGNSNIFGLFSPRKFLWGTWFPFWLSLRIFFERGVGVSNQPRPTPRRWKAVETVMTNGPVAHSK